MKTFARFLLIDVEYESRTAFDNFSQQIAQQIVPNLYLLDLKRLSDIPEFKTQPRPQTLDQKFELIIKYLDILVSKEF